MANVMGMRSGNPALTADTFTRYRAASATDRMTLQGTVNKTAHVARHPAHRCRLCLEPRAGGSEYRSVDRRLAPGRVRRRTGDDVQAGMGAVHNSGLRHARRRSPSAASRPIQGAVSRHRQPGGVAHLRHPRRPACRLPFGLHPVTENFRLGIIAATGGIYSYISSPSCWASSAQRPVDPLERHGRHRLQPVRRGHRRAEPGARLRLHRAGRGRGAPKYMEWYGAFGLLVTLVWLYLEILRLLSKLQERR